jgi:hypothetical protein
VGHLLAAGDIADDTFASESTAALIDNLPGTVAVLGDAAYPDGSYEDFMSFYEPTWGRHKARTRPAIGNHEYGTDRGAGYFSYFAEAAGDPLMGWYSYDIGDWHIVVLNSNCSEVGGCGADSPQGRWLAADLAANPRLCTAAYFHTPRFSSGQKHGNDLNTRDFWQVLYEHGAELVMGGNDHNYERFAPQTPDGFADPVDGITQFVVGTGGRFLRPVSSTPEPNSEALSNTTLKDAIPNDWAFGILKLDLMSWGYSWEFVRAAGGTFNDSGATACH